MNNIKDLLKFKVFFKHIKNGHPLFDKHLTEAIVEGDIKSHVSGKFPNSVSAITVAVIETFDREAICVGYSLCSNLDQFNKRVGRTISLSRAFHKLTNYFKDVNFSKHMDPKLNKIVIEEIPSNA